MHEFSKYLKVTIVTVGCGLALFLLFNLIVDPQARFNLVDLPGFNHEKTEIMESGGRAVKSLSLEHGTYDTVLLGSSRVENGLDPLHPVFRSHQVYNAGLSGTNFQETYQVFEFVKHRQQLKTLVIGLDFLLFASKRTVSGDFLTSRFAGLPLWRMQAQYLASYQTFLSSLKTVQNNRLGERSPYTDRGMRDRSLSYAMARIDHRDLFIKILTRNFLANQGVYGGFSYGVDRLDLLRTLIEQCRTDKIDLYLFITPEHARQSEAMRVLGLYPLFEQWKRDLTNVVAADAARHPAEKPIPLWDFTGYNSMTTEAIPLDTEKGKPMQWYWESSHFKKDLGNFVLDRLFAHQEPGCTVPEDFGVPLTPENVEAHLALLRTQQSRYHETHPYEVAEVEYLAQMTARFRGAQQKHSARLVAQNLRSVQPQTN
jgi:hypothetical protein